MQVSEYKLRQMMSQWYKAGQLRGRWEVNHEGEEPLSLDRLLDERDLDASRRDKILLSVKKYFKIDDDKKLYKGNILDFTYPRSIFCYLIGEYGIMDFSALGRMMKKDRTCVKSAHDRIKGLLEVRDEEVCGDVLNIKRVISGEELEKENWPCRRQANGAILKLLKGRPKKYKKGRMVVLRKIEKPKAEYSNTGHLKLINELSEAM